MHLGKNEGGDAMTRNEFDWETPIKALGVCYLLFNPTFSFQGRTKHKSLLMQGLPG